jgi:cytochrome c oxidase cbb3-type subunit I/II
VTAVVRTNLGELKWVAMEATDYTPLEAEGRRLFLQSGCTYCHSQYTRPTETDLRPWGTISTDPRRWGPAPEPGEYAFDTPPSFGNRGFAPDLARVGLKYGDEWHLAHFWNPPMVVPGSVMGGFSGLFDQPPEPVRIVEADGSGNTLERTAATERLFDFASQDHIQLTPNGEGLLFVPMRAQGKYPVIWTPNDEFTGETVRLVAETGAIQALTAYVQKLGMNRGRWRELYEPAYVDGTDLELPRSDEKIARGKQVYERHCLGCHGVEGDGNGPASTFTHAQRPRNFTYGMFKFKLTEGPLPSDRDLLRTITRGVRGTAMPAWYELPLEDRLAVIQYVKYELTADRSDPTEPYFYFESEPPGPPLEIGPPPRPTAELVAHGGEIWQQAKCWECHGRLGKGDGEKAAGLKDKWGFPIVPANLTRGQFKSGPTVTDVFRTISVGLIGTPMPSFQASFPEADR